VVFPIVAFDIFEFLLIDLSATEVDGNVLIVMILVEKVSDRVDGVAIKFLNSRSGERHGNDSISDVCEIEVEAVFLVPVFGSTDNLS
jgi:hypothetical protein